LDLMAGSPCSQGVDRILTNRPPLPHPFWVKEKKDSQNQLDPKQPQCGTNQTNRSLRREEKLKSNQSKEEQP